MNPVKIAQRRAIFLSFVQEIRTKLSEPSMGDFGAAVHSI